MIVQRQSAEIVADGSVSCQAASGYSNLVVLQLSQCTIYCSVEIASSQHKMAFVLQSNVIDRKPTSQARSYRSQIAIGDEDLSARAYITDVHIAFQQRGELCCMDATFCRYFDRRMKRVVSAFRLEADAILGQQVIAVSHIDIYLYRLRPFDYHKQQDSNKVYLQVEHQAAEELLIQNNIDSINLFLNHTRDSSITIPQSHQLACQQQIVVQVPFYSTSIPLTVKLQRAQSQIHIQLKGKLVCSIQHDSRIRNSYFVRHGARTQHLFLVHNDQLCLIHLAQVLCLFQSSASTQDYPVITSVLQLDRHKTKLGLDDNVLHIVHLDDKKASVIKLNTQHLNRYFGLIKLQLLLKNSLSLANSSHGAHKDSHITPVDSANMVSSTQIEIQQKMHNFQEQQSGLQQQLTQSCASFKAHQALLSESTTSSKIRDYLRLKEQTSENEQTIKQLLRSRRKLRCGFQQLIPQQNKTLDIPQEKQLEMRQLIEGDLCEKVKALQQQVRQLLNMN